MPDVCGRVKKIILKYSLPSNVHCSKYYQWKLLRLLNLTLLFSEPLVLQEWIHAKRKNWLTAYKGPVISNAGYRGGVKQGGVPKYFATFSWGMKTFNQGIFINSYIAHNSWNSAFAVKFLKILLLKSKCVHTIYHLLSKC